MRFEGKKYILVPKTLFFCLFFVAGIQQIFLNEYIYFSLYPCDVSKTDTHILEIEPEKLHE